MAAPQEARPYKGAGCKPQLLLSSEFPSRFQIDWAQKPLQDPHPGMISSITSEMSEAETGLCTISTLSLSSFILGSSWWLLHCPTFVFTFVQTLHSPLLRLQSPPVHIPTRWFSTGTGFLEHSGTKPHLNLVKSSAPCQLAQTAPHWRSSELMHPRLISSRPTSSSYSWKGELQEVIAQMLQHSEHHNEWHCRILHVINVLHRGGEWPLSSSVSQSVHQFCPNGIITSLHPFIFSIRMTILL